MFKKLSLLISVMALSVAIVACSEDKVSNTKVDLKAHYGYTDIAGKDSYIVVCDGAMLGMGFVEDGEAYVPYTEFRKYADNKCYIDKNEKAFVYTTATNIYDSYVGRNQYTDIDDTEYDYKCTIALEVNGAYYVSASFLKETGAKIDYKTVGNPNRIVVTSEFVRDEAVAKVDDNIRTDSSDRMDILASVKKGDSLIVVSEKDDYMQVTDMNGVTGYIKKSSLGEVAKKTVTTQGIPEEYTHITSDEKICLGWHQMAYAAGNDSLSSLIADATPLNVISPTWYTLADKSGNIESLSSSSYVAKAHDKGLQVWALVNDFNYDENGDYYVVDVLSHTTSRRKLIENLLDDVKDNDIDGINVDFECIPLIIADDYVQFICELSTVCRNEGIVLSVDMYVPSDINQYYNRETVLEVVDYLIIMGYDEHWAGCETAGSVASLPFVKKGIEETISEGDSKRVINAIPFYTRVWTETPIEYAEDGSLIVDDPIKGSYALDSQAVGFGTAEEDLEANGVNKFWVEDLSQYYAEYEEGNSLVRVWLEEEKSVQAKIDAMKEYELAGIACWRLGLEEDWVWDIISGYVNE